MLIIHLSHFLAQAITFLNVLTCVLMMGPTGFRIQVILFLFSDLRFISELNKSLTLQETLQHIPCPGSCDL